MNRENLENLLDQLHPVNQNLKAGQVFLPRRLEMAAVYLFLHPEVGTSEQREEIRGALLKLDETGVL